MRSGIPPLMLFGIRTPNIGGQLVAIGPTELSLANVDESLRCLDTSALTAQAAPLRCRTPRSREFEPKPTSR